MAGQSEADRKNASSYVRYEKDADSDDDKKKDDHDRDGSIAFPTTPSLFRNPL